MTSRHLGCLLGLGRALAASGDTSAAIKVFRRAVSADSTDSRPTTELGWLLHGMHRHGEAATAFAASAAIAPDDATVWAGLGAAHATAARYDQAATAYARAVALAPGDAMSYQRLGRALEDASNAVAASGAHSKRTRRRRRRALDAFKAAAKLRPLESSISADLERLVRREAIARAGGWSRDLERHIRAVVDPRGSRSLPTQDRT